MSFFATSRSHRALVAPTGADHGLGATAVAVATAGRDGRILQVNSTFAGLARRSREELVGAHPTVLRHPEMPLGLFKLLGDLLADGEPAAGYVHDLAGDGSSYWTLTSIVPGPDGFVVVQTAPTQGALLERVETVYATARAVERDALEHGADPAEAALKGAGAILEGIRAVGHLGYLPYQEAMLDLESTRQQTPVPVTVPRGIGFALESVHELGAGLADLAERCGGLAPLPAGLRSQIAQTHAEAQQLRGVLPRAARIVQGLAAAERQTNGAAGALTAKCVDVTGRLALANEAQEVLARRVALSIRIGLARRHAEALGHWLCGAAAGREDERATEAGVAALVRLLSADLDAIARDAERSRGAALHEAAVAIRVLGMTVGTWREMVERYHADDVLDEVLPHLDEQLDDCAARISGLAQALGAHAAPFGYLDIPALRDRVSSITHFVAAAGPEAVALSA